MNEYAGASQLYSGKIIKVRPVEYLDSLQVLNDHFVAAHGIMLSPQERRLLAGTGGKRGTLSIQQLWKMVYRILRICWKEGLCVGLGTDGTAHGGLSLWNEMKILPFCDECFLGCEKVRIQL